jgi:hypothetical protein
MKRRSMYSEPSRGLLRKFGEERPRRSGDGLCAVGDGPAMCASPLAAFSYRPAGRRRAERVWREGRRESLDRHPRLLHTLTCFGLSMKFSRSQRIKSSELRGVPAGPAHVTLAIAFTVQRSATVDPHFHKYNTYRKNTSSRTNGDRSLARCEVARSLSLCRAASKPSTAPRLEQKSEGRFGLPPSSQKRGRWPTGCWWCCWC